ncbi:MAG: M81 family metallopeptidase [bacterium]|jgi:microcystin degradation protein MlrC
MTKPRVLIAEFKHETNSFCSTKTGLKDYENRSLKQKDEIFSFFKGVRVELGGIIDGCKEEGLEMVPAIAGNAMPGGHVTRDVFEFIKNEILTVLKNDKNIDGILLSLHGAMVLEDAPDGEGELLTAIRAVVGPDMPIMATLDLHANLTTAMLENATALFPYNTYPHIDQYDRGYEAAKIMAATLRKEIKPVMKMKQLPILAPCMQTAKEPMHSLMEMVFAIEDKPNVINTAILHGFPWADIHDAGCSVLAVTNDDEQLAAEIVDEIGEVMMKRHKEFIAPAVPIEEAVKRAMEAPEGPIVLADIADNPGGGGPADGTQILQKMIEMGAKNAAVALILDPEVVDQAIKAGVGATITAKLGGKTEPAALHGEPIEVSGKVKTISDGVFVNKGPMGRGLRNTTGRTVVLDIDGIEVIVVENRVQPWDPEIFRRNGIEPTDKQIILVKSSLHFRAAFGPLAKEIIDVDAPGLLSPNFHFFDFNNVRRPIFPLDEIE